MIFNIPTHIIELLSNIENLLIKIIYKFKINLSRIEDKITLANSNLSYLYHEYEILQLPRNFRISEFNNNVVTIEYDYDNGITSSQEFTIKLEKDGTFRIFLYKIKNDDEDYYYALYPEYIETIEDDESLNELEKIVSRIFAFEYKIEDGQITYLSTDGINYLLENNILNDVNNEIDNLKETLSSAYIYKGSVNAYSNLPCSNKVLKVSISAGHYIQLSFPDKVIPKDAAKIRIEAKSSTGANYNLVLLGTSNLSKSFYIQKGVYTTATIDISNIDYSTLNGSFRISFTDSGSNILEIDKIYFLNSVGSTIGIIDTFDTYTIGTSGPVGTSTVNSVTIAYKDPATAAIQKAELSIGDVYNVLDNDKNYAWNGTDWDSLGGTFSLINYQTKEDTKLKTVSKNIVDAINELKTVIDTEEDDSTPSASNYILLNDNSTSETYKLYVDNGKLTLELNEGGSN